jgi:hypothetical protein
VGPTSYAGFGSESGTDADRRLGHDFLLRQRDLRHGSRKDVGIVEVKQQLAANTHLDQSIALWTAH